MQIIQTKFEGDALIKIMKTSFGARKRTNSNALFRLCSISFLKGIEG